MNKKIQNTLKKLGFVYYKKQILLALTARAIDTFDLISVRDGDSQAFIKRLLPHRSVRLVPDPVFAVFGDGTCHFSRPSMLRGNEKLILSARDETNSLNFPTKYFVFATNGSIFEKMNVSVDDAVRVLDGIAEHFELLPVIAVLNPRDDFEISQKIAQKLKKSIVFCPKTVSDIKKLAKKSDFCLCGRYHAALFSLACGAPTVAISNDPKLCSLCREFGLDDAISPNFFFKKATCGCNFAIQYVETALAEHKKSADTTARLVKASAEHTDRSVKKIFKHFLK